jgi:hypothetical protein
VTCAIVTTTGSYGPFSDGASSGTGGRYSCRVIGGASPTYPIGNYVTGNWSSDPDVRWAWFVGLNPVPYNQWIDSVWHVKWSWQQDTRNGCTDTTSTTGCFEWWVNGQKVATYSGPTLFYYADNGTGTGAGGPGQAYLQHGYYRPDDAWTGYTQPQVQLYHASTMIGPTPTSIGENIP